MFELKVILKLYVMVFLMATFLLVVTIHRLPEGAQRLVYLIENKKDWHDYRGMKLDKKRVGTGERGEPAKIGDEKLKKKEEEVSLIYGYNGLLSDMISVNRSLKDLRNRGCRTKKYLENLPSVSIVMPIFNEHLSVIMRSVHSLVNRSPPELIHEIILVDDASDLEDLRDKLDEYLSENFHNVRIIRLPKRTGLIGARLMGARNASAEVLIFLDAHIEATYNWLPPLLEPIAKNYRIAVCPFIDVIDDKTFEYSAQDEGARGSFNWVFDYKRLPLLPKNWEDRMTPFENPVMAGGLFAISTKFFWELGGYDEGLEIWGGEQYELSFKIWMCGGKLLDAPCSRVGHIYRGDRKPETNPPQDDYLRKNYKRVAEVWMDEYKEYLYEHDSAYANIDPGDITKQKVLREHLKCKTFKWYMDNVAFDLAKVFPPVEPPDYANGAIQSLADPTLCVDTLNREIHSEVGLHRCANNLTHPHHNQNWALSAHRDIRKRMEFFCLKVSSEEPNAPVTIWECSEEGGNQFWYYDPVNQWIVFERNGTRCLEAVLQTRALVVNECQPFDRKMNWKFGFVNLTALHTFFEDIPDISYAL